MTKKIRIIAVPAGEAPTWVRMAWVGLELPIADPPCHPAEQKGVLGGAPAQENLHGYPIWFHVAVTILSSKNEDAARWWDEWQRSSEFPPLRLIFGKQFCEVIE